MSDGLSSSKELLADAKNALGELKVIIQNFFSSNPYHVVIEKNEEYESSLHKIKLKRDMPRDLRTKTRHIALDIRGALDHVGYAAALSDGKTKPKKTMFPFAKSESEKTNVKNKNCKDLPQDIFELFWSFKPFIGGDDILWSLNEVANCSKHRIIVPVGNALHGRQIINNFSCDGWFDVDFPVYWDAKKDEAIICLVHSRAKTSYDIELGFNLNFGEVDIIEGKPVIETLEYILKKADEIINCAEPLIR
ncbi:hypothetical protein EIK76_01275 [Rheinheimera mesophila]|uniref:Uncharacterized protein n=1 Tax=Rheinheimera mesophila TaxID=1547515 RepID=A0A3P3QNE4_9GAMM|nr:hypothetical protein [Rheinheimera mesophila]KKK99838.1 hypothetical protein SD53_17760 [Rheinheimera mesophila]RRJ22746.1 hypothetical protein EIK76_01275 [Rheinheimera mesophila]